MTRLFKDPFLRLAATYAALMAVPYAFPLFTPDVQSAFAAQYAPLGFHLIAWSATVSAARRATDLQSRHFWTLMTIGLTCWVVNELVEIAVGAPTPPVALELASDVLFVLFYLFIALALEQEPHHQNRPKRLVTIRRFGAVMFTFSLLVYFAGLSATVNVDAYLTWLPSLLLYLVLDLYVVTRLIFLWRGSKSPVWGQTYLLLGITALLWVLTDSIEALGSASVVTLAPPGTPIDGLFFLMFFPLVAATRVDTWFPAESAHEPAEEGHRPSIEHGAAPLVTYVMALPILHFGLYTLGALDPQTRSAREAWVVLSVLGLGGLAFIYQRRLAQEYVRLWNHSQAMSARLQVGERLEAIGRLAAGIAHDFNNVLTIVIGNVDLIRKAPEAQGTMTSRYVDSLSAAATRGAALVKKLLGFGRQDLVVPEPTDLARFASTVATQWGRVLPETLRVDVTSDADTPRVLMDASVFEPVLVNLLANSRDSMPNGGVVSVKTGLVSVSHEQAEALGGEPGQYGVLRVRDAGVGMDSETMALVFEPFFTTKPFGEGTGMGLSMVYGIVKQHRGLIDLVSETGRGTEVTIFLPIVEHAAERAIERTPVDDADLNGTETILLVEDEPSVRDVAAYLLGAHGYTVISAADGEEALAIFNGAPDTIDLVLSDVVMPRMGGPALCEHIRRTHPHVPFVFVSGHAPESYRGQGDLDPSVPLLGKPWVKEELLAQIRGLLNRARSSTPNR